MILLLGSALLLGCALDLRDLDRDGDLDVALDETGETGETAEETGEPSPLVVCTNPAPVLVSGEDGPTVVEVAASEGVTCVDLNVPEGATKGWEVAFERYYFYVNGGMSGDGGVEVAVLPEADFETAEAPADGWVTDGADGLALGDWYVYDSVKHVLYAADVVYVLRNAAGDTWKLQFIDYYDDAGNFGFPSFRVQPLASP